MGWIGPITWRRSPATCSLHFRSRCFSPSRSQSCALPGATKLPRDQEWRARSSPRRAYASQGRPPTPGSPRRNIILPELRLLGPCQHVTWLDRPAHRRRNLPYSPTRPEGRSVARAALQAPAAVPHSRGDLRTSAPGAYLPAASASGTCAHRRAARAARRPDPMDQPSLQTSKSYIGDPGTATRARHLCPLFEFSTGQTGGHGRDFGIRVAGPGQKDFGGYPPVRRSSMLLATSSHMAANSNSSCLPKTFSVLSASRRYIVASCRR